RLVLEHTPRLGNLPGMGRGPGGCVERADDRRPADDVRYGSAADALHGDRVPPVQLADDRVPARADRVRRGTAAGAARLLRADLDRGGPVHLGAAARAPARGTGAGVNPPRE